MQAVVLNECFEKEPPTASVSRVTSTADAGVTEASARPARKRGRGADPEQTRTDLLDAAFTSVRTSGLGGTTARSIASLAHCNQAAIYYHFGNVDSLLVAALQRSSRRRLDRYEETITDVTDLAALIDTIETLYAEDRASGHLEVLAELVGGLTSSPALREGIDQATQPWLAFVESKITEAAIATPLAAALPADDVTDLLFSLVIGLELRNKIDGQHDRATRVFQLARLATLLGP